MDSRIAIALLCVFFVQTLAFSAGETSGYLLPFAQATSYKVLQGYNGPWGHEGHCAYAYDFQMPIGTPVHAARSGEVVHIVERHRDSTRTAGEENVVVIRHKDGTYARYYHLKQNGVKVALKDHVKQKQIIAFSGDSGASAGPHLHFDVTSGCFKWGCQTIKMEFGNAKDNPLKPGESY